MITLYSNMGKRGGELQILQDIGCALSVNTANSLYVKVQTLAN